VNADLEDAVEEAETHAEELDHEHDDERSKRRVEGVQVVLDLCLVKNETFQTEKKFEHIKLYEN
jgi:hypothetical protein